MGRPFLLLGLVLVLGAYAEGSFAPYPRCEVDCPLRSTVPPSVFVLSPTPNQLFKRADLIVASVTDDGRVDRVEVYRGGFKLHPGSIGGAPYAVELGTYGSENMEVLPSNTPITFQVVAWDIEGNSDTAEVTARYDTTRA